MAATKKTNQHHLNRTQELANVQPQPVLQTPKNLLAHALLIHSQGHVGNQNRLVNRIDALMKNRNGEAIHVVVRHVTMTESFEVMTREIVSDITKMIDLTIGIVTGTMVVDVQPIVRVATLKPTHIHQNKVTSNVQKLHDVNVK